MTSPLSMGGGAGAARVDLIRDGLPDVMRRIAPQSVDIPATQIRSAAAPAPVMVRALR